MIWQHAVPQGAFFPAPKKAGQELTLVAPTSNKTAASRCSVPSWATEGNKQRLKSGCRSTATPKQPRRPHTARVRLLARDSGPPIAVPATKLRAKVALGYKQ